MQMRVTSTLSSNRRFARKAIFLLSLIVSTSVATAQDGPPAWAYPVNPPGTQQTKEDGTLRSVPGSSVKMTITQINNRFSAPDWHPADYPKMPDIVKSGRNPEVFACGWCHRANGVGGPENANLTGLPAAYIIQQMADVKAGKRVSAVHQRGPTLNFALVAKNITDSEVEAAAAYFASIPAQSNVKVVETDTVPKTFIPWWHYAVAPGGEKEKEPIGQRIIEVPEHLELFENRDSRAQLIAYVPLGSTQMGQALASTGGGGRTVPCVGCHGPGLRGLGPVPGIAGRYATYIVRQLYDFKAGLRTGPMSPLMAQTVEKLDLDDMIALAAYAASLTP